MRKPCSTILIIVAGSAQRGCVGAGIDPAELIDEPWCLPPDDLPISPLCCGHISLVGTRGTPRVAVRSNSPHLSYAMVRTGRFLAVAPASTVQLGGRQLGLRPLPIKLAIQPGPIGIVTLKNRTLSPVAELFIDCARKFVKSLAKGTGRLSRRSGLS